MLRREAVAYLLEVDERPGACVFCLLEPPFPFLGGIEGLAG